MWRINKIILFILFLPIKSNSSYIEQLLEKIIPTKNDVYNKEHLFFYYFDNQTTKDFIKMKKDISNLNLAELVNKNKTIFDSCNSKTIFFNNLIAMKKYVEISKIMTCSKDKIKENLTYIEEEINKDFSNGEEFNEIQKNITLLQKNLSQNDTLSNYENQAKLLYSHYIDKKLNFQNKDTMQAIYNQFDKSFSQPLKKQELGKEKKALIILSIVFAIGVLIHYLLLTQSNEIMNQNIEILPYIDKLCC